jgi:molecular chaperone IbpA
MRSYDLTPLYRTTVGFDRMFDLLDNLGKSEATGYPPYNIERVDEDRYRITIAVAGFSESDLDLEIHENTLKVVGSKPESEQNRTFLHKSISGRSF